MSIEVGLRRGKQMVTRLPEEEWDDDCIIRRYKNYATVMFWGAIAYNWKGPCHIWTKESAEEKKENDQLAAYLRAEAMPAALKAWEAEQRKKGPNRRGRKAVFRFTGFSRRGKTGGIDWLRLVQFIFLEIIT
jgi:hypothetical protein